MAIDPQAFDKYRRSASEKTTLPRLIAGVAIILVFWVLSTLAVILAGMSVYVRIGDLGFLLLLIAAAALAFLMERKWRGAPSNNYFFQFDR